MASMAKMLRQLRFSLAALLLLTGITVTRAHADAAPFDLAGPSLAVTVTRNGTALPIAEVPNLAAGDVLTLRADFPDGQAAHYLLVAAFLRGSTNPPPEDWFHKSETWNKKDKAGLTLTVPDGAQQVLVFLAPETGGDFRTLVNAVRGRPGAFVRASQDLNQASLDRSRLNAYLAAIKQIQQTDASKLKEMAPVLGRSLAIQVDSKCFDKLTEQQAPCLMQNQDAIILNDGHSTSIVQALTSGPAADLATQLSYTPQANYGYASPYLQSVLDIARIMDSLHTAQYQYIPALATLDGEQMALLLNTPPSFHNPKSVLVIALPAVEDPQPPPLQAVNPQQTYCAQKDSQALAVEGAPLVFSTQYAHDTVLRVKTADGKLVNVPVKPDAVKGGLVVSAKDLKGVATANSIHGQLLGQWGFAKYDGPTFVLTADQAPHWQLAADGHQLLVVGKDDLLTLKAGDAACVESVQVTMPASDSAAAAIGAKPTKAVWKQLDPQQIQVTLPLKDAKPGELTLQVQEYGVPSPQTIALHAFAEAGHLEGFTFHAGDAQGVLRGTQLDDTATLLLSGVEFKPAGVAADGELSLAADDVKAADRLKAGEQAQAEVTMKDGRTMPLAVTIEGPRPVATLLAKTIAAHAADDTAIVLGSKDELPQDGTLTFSLKLQKPMSWSAEAEVEVATEDGALTTTVSSKLGTLTREDRSVAVARLVPAKAFGDGAFGQLKFRVSQKGSQGDWQPLATLVRLPQLTAVKCDASSNADIQPEDKSTPCTLTGTELFLLDSVASDISFTDPVTVPDGFTGSQLAVPRPRRGQLFVKLRDDPSVISKTAFAAPPASQDLPANANKLGEPAAAQSAPAGQLSATEPVSKMEQGSAKPPAAANISVPAQTAAQ